MSESTYGFFSVLCVSHTKHTHTTTNNTTPHTHTPPFWLKFAFFGSRAQDGANVSLNSPFVHVLCSCCCCRDRLCDSAFEKGKIGDNLFDVDSDPDLASGRFSSPTSPFSLPGHMSSPGLSGEGSALLQAINSSLGPRIDTANSQLALYEPQND